MMKLPPHRFFGGHFIWFIRYTTFRAFNTNCFTTTCNTGRPKQSAVMDFEIRRSAERGFVPYCKCWAPGRLHSLSYKGELSRFPSLFLQRWQQSLVLGWTLPFFSVMLEHHTETVLGCEQPGAEVTGVCRAKQGIWVPEAWVKKQI